MLEVAVIGAGPAGLTAARHLLAAQQASGGAAQAIRCCIFESSSTLGGSWACSSSCGSDKTKEDTKKARNNIGIHESNSQQSSSSTSSPSSATARIRNGHPRHQRMWEGLHTNLSKHTCRFSDFPWPSSSSTFPSTYEMNSYLTSYADQFIDPDCFYFNCQVTNIRPIPSPQVDGRHQEADDRSKDTSNSISMTNNNLYSIEWTDLDTLTTHQREFGGVVMATGFFSDPVFPPNITPTKTTTTATDTTTSDADTNRSPPTRIQVLHSNDYNNRDEIIDDDDVVAVIGSSFSALEIAVDVASVAKRVVSVLPTIPWVVPRYIPSDTKQNSYLLPVDLSFYRRTNPSMSCDESTILSEEECIQRNTYLQHLLGSGRQRDVIGDPTDFTKPPQVAISDYFLDLVADGTIEVVHGRLRKVDDETGVHVESSSSSSQQRRILSDVTKVICCTGYKPDLQKYVDESILDTIEYDSDEMFAPMTLCWETLHPSLKNFAFCGMYRGPYMGVMEQQARLAVATMLGTVQPTPEQYESALQISKQIRSQPRSNRPSFPRYDYVGFMDTIATILNSPPKWNTQVGDIISPAFYQSNVNDYSDEESASFTESAQDDINEEIQSSKDGKHVAEAVLSALIGSWKFHRDIVHFSNGYQEHVHGTIKYSRPNLGYVKYREDGFYRISDTKHLEVFREYEYECKPGSDLLEVFFVENGQRAHLFLSLKFTQSDGEEWVATSDHLCIKDLYKGTFKVKMDGLKATDLTISYRVKGPEKDYEATTYMSPQQ